MSLPSSRASCPAGFINSAPALFAARRGGKIYVESSRSAEGARHERQRPRQAVASRPAAAGADTECAAAWPAVAPDPLLAQSARHLDALQFRMADHPGQWHARPHRRGLLAGGDQARADRQRRKLPEGPAATARALAWPRRRAADERGRRLAQAAPRAGAAVHARSEE